MIARTGTRLLQSRPMPAGEIAAKSFLEPESAASVEAVSADDALSRESSPEVSLVKVQAQGSGRGSG